jgi:serine/threonine-protein kinase HipA
MTKCLYCYKEIKKSDEDFHPSCSKNIFGSSKPPIIDFSEDMIENLAERLIQSQTGVTGVQAKLSLNIEKVRGGNDRFTIVGLYGGYILKPQSSKYINLPENEDLCMKMAKLVGINIVPHSLIKLKSGQLAYITKRIDRIGGNKIPMEDMCQLTERMTEHKYNGSHEQIAKALIKYSSHPLLDIQNFYTQVLFSYIIGNSDMHLKNFSIIKDAGLGYILSPGYDMLSTLLVSDDKEELALTLNGRRNRIKQSDFYTAMKESGIAEKVIEKIFLSFSKIKNQWFNLIEVSFLPTEQQEKFKQLINAKLLNLNIE